MKNRLRPVMRQRGSRPKKFRKQSVCLPMKVFEFGKKRASGPRFCNNFSAYVRDLILDDAKQAGVLVE